MRCLNRIRNAGYSLILCEDGFEISPASKLNQFQRDFLKLHKAQLIYELKEQASISSQSPIAADALSANDLQLIMDYLMAIAETDQEMIDELIDHCKNDKKTLEYTLEKASIERNKKLGH